MRAADPELPLERGALLLGRHRVERRIGGGGAGQVYAAHDELLGRNVAVKVLRPGPKGSSRDVERLRREARAAVALRHPNVVEVHDLVVEQGDTTFLVMELLDGRTLREVVSDDGLLPAELASSLGAQLLDALSAAHEHGLVHRDVKPDNIMVVEEPGEEPRVKVLDFGAVKVQAADVELSQLTASNVVLGTWQYIAPEQVRGGIVDGRADVYSAGATLFFGLTALRPHQAAGAERVTFAMSDQPAPALRTIRPDLDEALASIIDRALAKDVAQRWPSAAAMRDALRAWSASRRVRAASGPMRARPGAAHARSEATFTHVSRTVVLDAGLRAEAARKALSPVTERLSVEALAAIAAAATAPSRPAASRAHRARAVASRVALVVGGAVLFALGLVGGGLFFR